MIILILVTSAFTLSFGHASEYFDSMDLEKKKEFHLKGKVTIVEQIENSPWPRVSIIRQVKTDFEKAAGVFTDYYYNESEDTKYSLSKYILPLIPEHAVSLGSSQLDLKMTVQLFPNIFKKVKYTLSVLIHKQVQRYVISWKKKSSDPDLLDLVGSVEFEPYLQSTLMIWRNLLIPSDSDASGGTYFMLRKVEKDIAALANFMEWEGINHPEQSEKRVLNLNRRF